MATKAFSLNKVERYQEVAAFNTDIEKCQGGFATSAEGAGLGKRVMLLITALAVWFVFNLKAKEKETRRQAEIAQQNEKKADAASTLAEVRSIELRKTLYAGEMKAALAAETQGGAFRRRGEKVSA